MSGSSTRHPSGPPEGSTPARVGFIGIGLMGEGMARNILKAGYPLTVWNRTPGKTDSLTAAGAREASDPAQAARESDVVIIMVSDTAAVEEVIFGRPDGVAAGARPGLTVVDMSTISPAAAVDMASRLEAMGVDMLDAPVSGGTEGAAQGTLSIMVGGKESVYRRWFPLLQAMGERITLIGGPGAGQFTKLANQILVVGNALAMSEALVFAARAGLDLDKVHEAIGSGAGGSWMFTHRGPQILQGDFRPGFTIALQQKDVRLALEAADPLGAPLPATALVHQLYATLEARGLAHEGNHALVKALEALAGVEARSAGSRHRDG